MSTLPAHSPVPDDFVTVAEAAALLRVAPSTIRRWIRQGTVPAYRIGPRRVALKRGELATLVEPATQPGPSPVGGSSAEDLSSRRLTPEEQARGLAALAHAERLAKEIFAGRNDRSLPSSLDLLHEARDERMRQLP